MPTIHRPAFVATLAIAAAGFAYTPASHACGGTFSGGSPTSKNVDQSGENILFVSDGQSTEAHIQIKYDGHDATRFGWVLPLQSMPTAISVGSQQLFTNLLSASVPSYGFQTVSDCQPCPVFVGGMGGNGSSGAGGGAAGKGGATGGGGGPNVTFQATVGAFDVVVLQGGTADEVMTWLGDNQYQQPAAAKPILEDYLSKGYLFLAAKLGTGSTVSEIHPLVVTYPGDKPCIPLKLSAVAATPNMGVRAFFLGKGRWVPTNYKHVVPNQARVDWLSLGANYEITIGAAVDDPLSGGHGFATEYAGSNNVVSPAGLYSSSWSSAPFVGIDVTKVVSTLTSQGLMSCSGVGPSAKCAFNHPLVEGLLNELIPVPAGMQEAAFYACLSCNKASIDLTKWDAAKLVKGIDERIVAPGQHATAVLKSSTYLTRLFTTISPDEMTEDPDFQERADLPAVSSMKNLAVRHLKCGGAAGMDIPGGREIALAPGWPSWPSSMPWAERIEDLSGPPGTPPVVLVDNKVVIDQGIAAWNTQNAWPPPMCGGAGGAKGGAGGAGGAKAGAGGVTAGGGKGGAPSATGGSGTSGPEGGAPSQASPVATGPRDEVSGGGGCEVSGHGASGDLARWGFLLAAIAAFSRAKRRLPT